MRKIFIPLFLLSALISYAQKKKDKKDLDPIIDRASWYEGSIALNDGEELKGVVKYNDQTGVLSFQDGTQTRVFTSRNVLGFEFFDESLQKQRIFYSLPYEDPKTNAMRPLFFEVVKEFKNFAVLSKADPVEMEQVRRTNDGPNYGVYDVEFWSDAVGGVKNIAKQVETIYLMNSLGEIEPYLRTTHKDVDGFYIDKKGSKNKVVDKDVLEEYVTPAMYEKMRKFAKENDLKFKRRDDLIRILAYYEQLLKEEN